jgi:hypothetical protein
LCALKRLDSEPANIHHPPTFFCVVVENTASVLFRQGLFDNQKKPSVIMADAPITLRTRKFIRNPLLARKQMVV